MAALVPVPGEAQEDAPGSAPTTPAPVDPSDAAGAEPSVEAATIALTTPADGAHVRGLVPVAATTTGPVPEVTFGVSLDNGLTFVPIGTDQDPADGWALSWDTTGLEGPATVAAWADPTTADTVTVTVDNTAPTVDLTLRQGRFSPNGDGNADFAKGTVTLAEGVRLTLEVRRSGATLRTLVDDEVRGPGPVAFDWDGRRTDGRRAGDGYYTVRATVLDEAGNAAEATASGTVDTTPPRVTWVRLTPNPQRRTGRMWIHIRIRGERTPVHLTLEALDRFGVAARRRGVTVKPGYRALRWGPRYRNGTYLWPGRYRMRIRADDGVGNRSRSGAKVFRVHRPVANRAVSRVGRSGNRVALTFDDCNYGRTWSRILRTLRTKRVNASFFCTGRNVSRFARQARRTVQDGNTIGSHTPDHVRIGQISPAAVRHRLRRDQATWWRVAKTTPSPFWRPPYGDRSRPAQRAAGRVGFRWTTFWSTDPRDWERPGRSALTNHVVRHARGGSIVLLHVLPGTADALPGLIKRLRAKGLRPVSLEELFHAAGRHRG